MVNQSLVGLGVITKLFITKSPSLSGKVVNDSVIKLNADLSVGEALQSDLTFHLYSVSGNKPVRVKTESVDVTVIQLPPIAFLYFTVNVSAQFTSAQLIVALLADKTISIKDAGTGHVVISPWFSVPISGGFELFTRNL